MDTLGPRLMNTSDSVAEALFGGTKRRVLGLLFGQPDRSFYLRQVVRETGAGLGAVQRELARLVNAGLVLRVPQGQQVHFSANPGAPVYDDLRNLLVKTAGIADVIRKALRGLHRNKLIDLAFIYGSVASGSQRPGSDIDLVVVGRTTLTVLLPRLRRLQRQLGREINPTIYTPEELKSKYSHREHFGRRVMERPKIMLLGTENDLAKLVGEPMARRA
jgi:predicted nucleotidyltransferase